MTKSKRALLFDSLLFDFFIELFLQLFLYFLILWIIIQVIVFIRIYLIIVQFTTFFPIVPFCISVALSTNSSTQSTLSLFHIFDKAVRSTQQNTISSSVPGSIRILKQRKQILSLQILRNILQITQVSQCRIDIQHFYHT